MTTLNSDQNLPPLDRKTFEAIYDLHWKQLFGICYHHCEEIDSAQEMVQDIFCSLWERRESLRVQGSMEHYLVRAAKNKVIDHFRNKPKSLIPLGEIETNRLGSAESYTENDVLYHSLHQQIGNLVEQLPFQCKQVYQMSREQGLSTEEIALRLSISEKTAKNHLTKALNFLRLHLHEYK